MWCCVFNRFDLMEEILANGTLEKDQKVELFEENKSARVFMGHPDAPVSRHIGMGTKLGIAFLIKNCTLLCQNKYVLPGKGHFCL